jgi:hypothetical protein
MRGAFLSIVTSNIVVAEVRQNWHQIISDIKNIHAIASGDTGSYAGTDDILSLSA